ERDVIAPVARERRFGLLHRALLTGHSAVSWSGCWKFVSEALNASTFGSSPSRRIGSACSVSTKSSLSFGLSWITGGARRGSSSEPIATSIALGYSKVSGVPQSSQNPRRTLSELAKRFGVPRVQTSSCAVTSGP